MRIGGEIGAANPGEESFEARVAGSIRTQDQGVDKEAHEIVQRFVAPAGDGAAQGDVSAGPQAGEQDGETGLQDHEQGCLVLLRELEQAAVQAGLDFEKAMESPW